MDVKRIAVLRDVTRAFEPVSYVIKYITTFKIISPRGMLALKYQGHGAGGRDYLHFVLDSDNYTRQSGTSGLIIRYKI